MSDITIISQGQRIVGTVSAGEDLIVLGRIEGRIQSEATVTIEAQAIVEGDIHARHVLVKGVVVGEIAAVDGIEIAASAQVLGDLKTRRLALRPGGRVAGLAQSGIEVPPFSYGSRGNSARRATTSSAPTFTSQPASTPWPRDEVVETSPRPSAQPALQQHDQRKGKKEPSREVS